jgi:membrane associated rhomboid family serine protease
MIIPWNTDAPLYHFPFATIGLLVVNTAAFVAALGQDDPEPWMLAFGEGLQPVQWVTSMFMHNDIMHLVGNLIFLWGFGLVIEGKIGWWRFLLVYLGLGIVQAAVVQMCMQHRPGFALGASGAIYGLLAMALIWAPRNEMSCLAFFTLRPFHFQVPILLFVTLYVSLELLSAWLSDFEMSSAMLHLAGAVPGFAVGIAMLKLGWVECENWDVFAVLAGREGEAPKAKVNVREQAKRRGQLEAQRAAAIAQFQQYLAAGHPAAAVTLHRKMTEADATWQLDQADLLELIKALHQKQLWSESVGPMVELLRLAPDGSARLRLKLAQILVVHEKRPGRALGVLEKIPAGTLSGDLETARKRLEAQAQKMYADGELEVDGEDW